MSWKKEVFENFKLYAVTDLKDEAAAHLEKIEAACRGGADIIQLRSKNLNDAGFLRLGVKIRVLTDRYQKLFFVNDRPDVALAAGADGVHLGQEDLPVAAVKTLCARQGTKLWIGKSTHSMPQALQAEKEGADYIAVGPVLRPRQNGGMRPWVWI